VPLEVLIFFDPAGVMREPIDDGSRKLECGLHLVREMTRNKAKRCETMRG
jgi:hypothetical protein